MDLKPQTERSYFIENTSLDLSALGHIPLELTLRLSRRKNKENIFVARQTKQMSLRWKKLDFITSFDGYILCQKKIK